MTIKDVEPVRISFSEMHLALARGDVEAYVGAEPGGSFDLERCRQAGRIPLLHRHGQSEYGVRRASGDCEKRPQLVRTILEIHRKASEFAMANPPR